MIVIKTNAKFRHVDHTCSKGDESLSIPHDDHFPHKKHDKVKNVNVNVNINKSEDEGPPGLTRLSEVISTLRPKLEEASPEIAKMANNLSNAIAGLNK